METPNRVLRNLHLANAQTFTTPVKVPASPFLKSLGYGTGVNVYCLERSPNPSGQLRSPWAIKRVSRRTRITNKENSELFNERIIKEAEILRQLKHPNIIGFRAITQAKDGVDTLALECCNTSLGNLLEERYENELSSLPAKYTTKMIIDISSALDYLHTKAKLLHGDLKSHNILVKGDFEICKLCDFGVSLPLNEDNVINFKETPQLQYVGTDLWSAPEIINEDYIISPRTEIFSFGLVIYETLALVPPHTLKLNNAEYKDVSVDSADKSLECIEEDEEKSEDLSSMIMAFGTRPPLPDAFEFGDEYNVIIELFYVCTNSSPEDRPTAKVIYKSLTKEVI